ncbi:MAG: hypothetical protein FWE67_02560, partial [Planctomycetaceae bacterium]|nr:hypothetical protein [Planctomycetaceae bacterium]
MLKCFNVRRWSLTVMTVLAVSVAGSLCAEPLPTANPPVEFDYYTSPEGTSYAAVGLRSIPVTNDIPCETVVLFNTSASQKGQARKDSFETLNSVLANLPAGTKVKLYALDVEANALTPDFAAVGSPELGIALQQLQRRVPLGATDLTSGIQAAKTSFSGRNPNVKRSVIYLGDGRSMARTVDVPVFKKEIDDYRNAKIAFNACTIGVNANLGLTAAFANQTGGLLVDMNTTIKNEYGKVIEAVDEAIAQNKEFAEMPNFGNTAGKKLAEAVQATVVWVNSDSYSFPSSWTVYPKQLQPLRSDRETIVIAKTDAAVEPFKLEVQGVAPGKEVKFGWNFAPNNNPGVKNANKYLAVVAGVAAKDDGLTMPIVGWEGLDSLRDNFAVNIVNQLRQAEKAIESGDSQSAAKLLNNILKYDPQNAAALRLLGTANESLQAAVHGKVGRNAADDVKTKGTYVESIPIPKEDDKPADDDKPVAAYVDNVRLEQSIEAQKIENEVRKVIIETSKFMNTDPELCLQELKLTQQMVRDNAALSPDYRSMLLDRLSNQIKQVTHAQYLNDKKRERQVRSEGVRQEREMTLQALQGNREKAVPVFDRFDFLMSTGEYKVAVKVAEEVAAQLLPDDTTPFTASLLASMTSYIEEYEQLRQRRIIGFVEAMMTAERSFVPIPDEPPITYIEPERWRILSDRRRERYAVADLSDSGEAQKKITKALDRTIDIELDDTLTFEDLFNMIKEKNPGMNIAIDPKGAGAVGIQLSSNVVREPVSYHGVKLRSALRLILSGQDLTYCIQDEVLLITTEDEAKKHMSVKVYPMQDLVVDPTPMGGGMGGMGGGMMGGGMMGGG